MSARAELISMVNDIRLDCADGKGTLGEVSDRIMEIAKRVMIEESALASPPFEDPKAVTTTTPCPRSEDGECDGFLVGPYKINDQPQFAVHCNECQWWALS